VHVYLPLHLISLLFLGEELRFRKEGEGNRILGVYDTFDRDGKNVSVKKYLYSVDDIIQYFQDLCALRFQLMIRFEVKQSLMIVHFIDLSY